MLDIYCSINITSVDFCELFHPKKMVDIYVILANLLLFYNIILKGIVVWVMKCFSLT